MMGFQNVASNECAVVTYSKDRNRIGMKIINQILNLSFK